MTETQAAAGQLPGEQPLGSLYRRVIVPLVRVTTLLVVVGFLLGGIVFGIAAADAIYGEDPQVDLDTGFTVVHPKALADSGDTISRYATPAGKAMGGIAGGVVGLAGGLIATFSIEVGVTVYLAARKYLRA